MTASFCGTIGLFRVSRKIIFNGQLLKHFFSKYTRNHRYSSLNPTNTRARNSSCTLPRSKRTSPMRRKGSFASIKRKEKKHRLSLIKFQPVSPTNTCPECRSSTAFIRGHVSYAIIPNTGSRGVNDI